MAAKEPPAFLIGVISDTHGDLDPAVLEVFAGADHILHAGDIGPQRVLLDLEAIAPVTAVLGNTDHSSSHPALKVTERVMLAGMTFLVTHKAPSFEPGRGVDVVVTGHTHCARVHHQAGVLHLNPGSASQPRGAQGPSVALVTITDEHVDVRILPLGDV